MKKAVLSVALALGIAQLQAQEATPYSLSLEQAIEMGLNNHQQLKIAQSRIQVGDEQIKVSKSQQLPSVGFSANAFYLGDALILDSDWSKAQTVDMPHFGNSFGLQASQLLYKGGVIKKSIEMAELQKQIAELDFAANEQDIKFLIISNYLDICKLINQTQVLEQNRILAEQLHGNIVKLYEEEMVTRNEIIRAELQIKNLNQTILTMKNNHAILSNRMSYALGLPNNILIMPVENLNAGIIVQSQDYYAEIAMYQHSALRSAEKNIEIANKNVSIQQTNMFPTVSAFGGYNMQRPLTSGAPVLDMYSNTWQAGISLNFNIDQLFKAKRQVNLSRSQANMTREALTYVQQNVETGVNAAYLKCMEAQQQISLVDEARKLAEENYEIVRNKYLNQLAITAEMTDASNAKLNAELEYANAVINAMFQYYNLMKSTESL